MPRPLLYREVESLDAAHLAEVLGQFNGFNNCHNTLYQPVTDFS